MADKKIKKGAKGAGIAGAVIGAGIAVAATKILSDEKARSKLKGEFSRVRKQVEGVIERARKTATMKPAKKAIASKTSKPKKVAERPSPVKKTTKKK